MRAIGMRAGTGAVWYAVLELNPDGTVNWLNSTNEFRWLVPKAATEKGSKLRETYIEFTRLFAKYAPDRAVLKIAESSSFRAPSVDRVAIEAVIILVAEQQSKPVTEKRYSQLKGTSKQALNSGNVDDFTTTHIAKPNSGWCPELAEALAAALREIGK